VAPDGSETSRLAAVNLDWDHLRAVDILAALASFVPPGGRCDGQGQQNEEDNFD
jgi:hypothetical protein